MNEKEYTIGGKTFVQRALVLGQIKQLAEVLTGVSVPVTANLTILISALGDRLPRAMAVVLTEKDKLPKDKNLDEETEFHIWNLDSQVLKEVVTDFFGVNPISFVLEKLTENMKKITKEMENLPDGLTKQLFSSQKETSVAET